MAALDTLPELGAWRDDAACLGDDHPDDWFVEHGSDVDRAIAVCGRCPVRVDCLAHALTAGETDGIWGGRTPAELDDIRAAARASSRRRRQRGD